MNNKHITTAMIITILVISLLVLNATTTTNTSNNTPTTNPNTQEPQNDTARYTAQEVGLSFEYDAGEGGYEVDDVTSEVKGEIAIESPNIVQVLRIINAKEKQELEESTEPREGPPTITITIFENPQNKSASMWVNDTSSFSNTTLTVGDIDQDVTVDGANAVRYTTDGLYMNQNVVVAHAGYIYHFSGAYIEEDSAIYRDFQELIESVEFAFTTQ